MPEVKRRWYRWGFFAFIVASVLVILLTLGEKEPERFVAFNVDSGESFLSVAERLQDEGLIQSESFFYYLARLTGKSADLKAGEYELHDQMNAWDILNVVTGSQVKLYRVTIREGMNIFQIARLLRRKGLVDEVQFLETAWDPNVVEEFSIPSISVEGYLFPETYFIPRGASPKKIIRTFVEMFWTKVPESYTKAARKGDLSFHEHVKMASVIEKETGFAAEMGLISSVFFNRIDRGMRLQSDPTAVYDLLPYGGRVRREHLFRKTPFNTYATSGLPYTPICNPGLLAIQAAIFPQKSDYLFFVSRRDGSHHFSETYKEHKAAIDKYLR